MSTSKKPGGNVPPTQENEPTLEDFHALVRRKMIESGEDPDALDFDLMDFSDDEEAGPWLN